MRGLQGSPIITLPLASFPHGTPSLMHNGGRVTVVVLTHNRVAEVMHTLDRLSSLPERPPIIVVDNGSEDGTETSVACAFPDVTVIRLPRNIGAAARNTGLLCARTPYVALSDDDTWWEPGSLLHAAELMDHSADVAVITGKVLVGSRGQVDPTSRVMAHSRLPLEGTLPGVPVLGFLAGACVLRRSAVLQVGGFEPRFFIGGEETLVALDLAAAGWQMVYHEDLVVRHYPSPIRDSGTRRSFLLRNGIWVAWLRRPLPSAVRQTIRLLIHRPSASGDALRETIMGLPWVLRRRHIVPRELEQRLQRLEA
jgi:GT2 family glycosyltransferase